MPIVVAVLVLLTLLVLLDLVLTYGVIRKLREHTERLDLVSHPEPQMAGLPTPAFSATTATGETVSAQLFDGGGLAVFLAPDCPGCRSQLPDVRQKLATAVAAAVPVLLVVTRLHPERDLGAEAAEIDELLAALDGGVAVVREPLDGAVQSAFKVTSYPGFFRIGADGRIAVATNHATQLPDEAEPAASAGRADALAVGR
ncbi:peroxiredoxin family protein [Virgisporangium aurantiacum]|uniref:Thioredoxin domain-containing protein n=1 Tax=Virgisporangium aurantiacum TaxID=175570 RepID=A0A8J4E0I4_9ACTN|nr:redoxin domain-containing protein [Virgisporangium aurantiacum]GIJ56846.1 hypothetical protein Vau01_043620 [Virgisporangium aurantiacum]